jgi:predicted O-methyltransferase YrrM
VPAAKTPPDPFASVRAATDAHRAQHGCNAHPYANGALLGVLAGAANARRILELGTALGYTALWLAYGAPDAVIDTVERDEEHVRLARENVTANDLDGHIIVHHGDFVDVISGLDSGYDVAFFDGFAPSPPVLKAMRALLRTRGVLISANLTHGGKEAEAYRTSLMNRKMWLTGFIGPEAETAISIKL